MAVRNVSIRLSVKDGETVKRALEQLGSEGQRALKRIETASAPASKGLLALNAAGKEGKAAVQNYAASAGPLSPILTAIGPAGLAAAAGIGAVTLGIGAALRVTHQALEDFDKIAKTSDKLGIATDALQEYRFIASQSGVAQQTLDMGLQRLTRRAGDAARGVGEAVKVFEALNVRVLDTSGNLRPVEDIFNDVADSIAGMDGDAEKLSATVKLVDSEAAGMVNLFRRGSVEIDSMRGSAREFGFVIDEHVLRNVEATNDRLDILHRIIDANLKSAFVDLAPVLVQAAELMADIARETNNIIQSFKDVANRSTNKLFDDWIESLEQLQNLEGKSRIGYTGFGGASASYDADLVRKQIEERAAEIEDILASRGFEIELSDEAKEILANPLKGIGADLRDLIKLTRTHNTTKPVLDNDPADPLSGYNTLANRQVLQQLENEKQRLELVFQGKEAEAEILKIKDRLKNASQTEIDKAVSLTYSIHGIRNAIAEKNKATHDGLDANQKIIQSLQQQLDLEKQLLSPGGEREVFIRKEIVKLDEKAVPGQIEQARQQAGALFDFRESRKQQQASDAVLQSNQRIIESLQERLRVQRILSDEGERSSEIYQVTGRIAADSTGLQTEQVNQQIQMVKDLAAQLQHLRDSGEAKQLSLQHLLPEDQFKRDIERLHQLRDTGALTARAYGEEYDAAYRRMLESSETAWAGMERGVLRFRDTVRTVAGQTERLFSNALYGVSDLLTNVLGRGELDLDSFFSSLQMNAARELSGSITSGLFANKDSNPLGFLGNLFPFGGKRHSGGPVEAGVTYLIGRDGAEEFFTPGVPGQMTPADSYQYFPTTNFKSINQAVTNNTSNNTTNQGAQVGKIELTQNFYRDGAPSEESPGFNASQYQVLKELSNSFRDAGRHV